MNEQLRLALGREQLDEMNQNTETLNGLVAKGVINRSFMDYLSNLMIIDFKIWEAGAYAQQGRFREATSSLVDAKLTLDGIVISRISSSRRTNPKFRFGDQIPEYQQAIYDLAKERYETAVDKIEEVLGRAA